MNYQNRIKEIESTIEELQELWEKADKRNDYMTCHTLTGLIKEKQDIIEKIKYLIEFKNGGIK